MALFDKKGKKLSLDEILKGIEYLSDDDKAKVKAKMEDLYKAEDEREIDKIEEGKADDKDVADDKAEDVKEESEEIGKDVDEVEEEIETDDKAEGVETEEVAEETEEPKAEEIAETEEVEPVEEFADDKTEEQEDVGERLAARVAEIEKYISELEPLVELMKEFTNKQAKKFGYEGKIPGVRKSFDEMSTEELSRSITSEI